MELFAAFMDLEKADDRADREALWNVLKIYDVGGQLKEGIKAFYRDAMHVQRWMVSLVIVLQLEWE